MDIQQRINRLVRSHETNNPYRIAKEKGIVIIEAPLGEINGFYHRSNNIRIIYLNRDLSEDKKRFTCAHELGHAILHPALPSLSLSVSTYTIKRESEANEFATKLLTFGADEQYESKSQVLQCYGIHEDMERYL